MKKMTDFRREVLTDMAQSFSKVIGMTCKTHEELDLVLDIINTRYPFDPYQNVDMTPDAEGRTTGDVNDQ